MKREDDFEQRRLHLADLSDQQLYERFWELTEKVVEPLLQLGRTNTTPSVERSVLLRMGVSSLDTQKIVAGCMDRGLMGHGAGHVLYRFAKQRGIGIREASELLAQGAGWEEAVAFWEKEDSGHDRNHGTAAAQ